MTGTGQVIPAGNGPGGVDINALIKGMVSRDIWTYWYVLNIPAGTTVAQSYTLFNAVAGDIDPYNAGVTLSKVQTNMPSRANAGLAAPRDLVLDSIGTGFSSNTRLADQNAFLTNSYFEFKILDKVFFEGPLTLFPSGTGLMGFSDITGEGVWQNGQVGIHNRKRFGDYSKYIAPLMQFSFIIYFPQASNLFTTLAAGSPTFGNGISLRVDLNGLTDRPVQ